MFLSLYWLWRGFFNIPWKILGFVKLVFRGYAWFFFQRWVINNSLALLVINLLWDLIKSLLVILYLTKNHSSILVLASSNFFTGIFLVAKLGKMDRLLGVGINLFPLIPLINHTRKIFAMGTIHFASSVILIFCRSHVRLIMALEIFLLARWSLPNLITCFFLSLNITLEILRPRKPLTMRNSSLLHSRIYLTIFSTNFLNFGSCLRGNTQKKVKVSRDS